ncbi:hypothetical protein JAAARDRAFT_448042 [Jaapia argillacea MUCL 33604]|uniref:Cytochrome P450 n=1 Tax=Jaapia argillacea MUCL 33604 TaxID=933084 RepID=A0A067Q504_9AGAM|nr:hypothetical protein JAAARDRAFT_448042 [Jaapia argillacea MUCL 33604]
MPPSLNFTDVAVLTLGVASLAYVFQKRSPAPLPPGPRGWPIIGNILDMPTVQPWLGFKKWGEKWGNMVYVNLLGQPMVVLNSPKVAVDMLDKKSSIYSDRPTFTMAGELVGWTNVTPFLHYGDTFRESRRLTHQIMGSKKSIQVFLPMVERQTHRFIQRVSDDPEHVYEYIRGTAGAIILNLAYGYEVKEDRDELVALVDEAMQQFSILTTPNAFLVDAFPILRHIPNWFPGATFKRLAIEYKKTLTDMATVPFLYTKGQVATGTAQPSFASTLLENTELTEEQEESIKWTAAALYGGGSDTTVSSIYTFFLAMTLYPEVQKKAQAELDTVVGTDRLPSPADREHLPYVDALVKEVYRWHPVGPLGLPHRLIQDDIHDGYFIPKGTVVIANIWNILHDEDTYQNPMAFDPERFLSAPGKLPEQDPRAFSFGFGRRSCPGLNLAEASIFMSCAMVLSVFNITKAVNGDGSVVTPSAEFQDGTVSHPKPFRCSIKPRSLKAEALIHSAE